MDGRFKQPLEGIARLRALLAKVPVCPERLRATWALDDDDLVAAADRMRPVQAEADRITGERVRAVADVERISARAISLSLEQHERDDRFRLKRVKSRREPTRATV